MAKRASDQSLKSIQQEWALSLRTMRQRKLRFPSARLPVAVAVVAMLGMMMAALPSAGSSQAAEPQSKSIAITFDDLPWAGSSPGASDLAARFSQLVEKLKAEAVPAIGFVNEGKLEGDDRESKVNLLKAWLNAGFELGNHTYSHRDLNEMSLEEFQDEVKRGETVTRRLMEELQRKLVFFRHPFLRTGETIEKKAGAGRILKELGYTIAPVTVENSDYIFNRVYLYALQRGERKDAAEVASAYLKFSEQMLSYQEDLAERSVRRPMPHIQLLHANQINADYLDFVLAIFKRRGYSFISLEEALTNRAYSRQDRYVGPDGIGWIYRWDQDLIQKKAWQNEPDPPDSIIQSYHAIGNR